MIINYYSFTEFISNLIAYILTIIFYPKARLIRRPCYIRGKKSLSYGKNLTLGHACRLDLPGKKKTLFIGNDCEIGDYVHIVAHEKVVIGNNVLIASKVFISDTNHGNYRAENQDSPEIAPKNRLLITNSVYIGDKVWIGENAIILPGVKIGNGCIIGGNSLVNKSFKENTMIAGIPAKPIKVYDSNIKKWISIKNKTN